MNTRVVDVQKALSDLKDSFLILEDNLQLFHEWRVHAYKVVAGQLRIILCDTKNWGVDNSILWKLIGILFSDLKFHPLWGWIENLPESLINSLVLSIPGNFTFENGKMTDCQIFDYDWTPMSLPDWLNQKLLNKETTLRILIKSVAEKIGGSHSDDQYGSTILFAKETQIWDEESQITYIIGIWDYICWYLKRILEDPRYMNLVSNLK